MRTETAANEHHGETGRTRNRGQLRLAVAADRRVRRNRRATIGTVEGLGFHQRVRTRSDSDGILSLKSTLRSGRYRSRLRNSLYHSELKVCTEKCWTNQLALCDAGA